MPNPGTEGPAGYHHPPWPRGQPTPSSCARSIAAHRPPRRRRPAAQGRPQSRRRPLTCCRGPGELRPPPPQPQWGPPSAGLGTRRGGHRLWKGRKAGAGEPPPSHPSDSPANSTHRTASSKALGEKVRFHEGTRSQSVGHLPGRAEGRC